MELKRWGGAYCYTSARGCSFRAASPISKKRDGLTTKERKHRRTLPCQGINASLRKKDISAIRPIKKRGEARYGNRRIRDQNFCKRSRLIGQNTRGSLKENKPEPDNVWEGGCASCRTRENARGLEQVFSGKGTMVPETLSRKNRGYHFVEFLRKKISVFKTTKREGRYGSARLACGEGRKSPLAEALSGPQGPSHEGPFTKKGRIEILKRQGKRIRA